MVGVGASRAARRSWVLGVLFEAAGVDDLRYVLPDISVTLTVPPDRPVWSSTEPTSAGPN